MDNPGGDSSKDSHLNPTKPLQACSSGNDNCKGGVTCPCGNDCRCSEIQCRDLTPPKGCRYGNPKCWHGDTCSCDKGCTCGEPLRQQCILDTCPCDKDCGCSEIQQLDLNPSKACRYGNDNCWNGDACSCGKGCACGIPLPRQCGPCRNGNSKCWGGLACPCTEDCCCGNTNQYNSPRPASAGCEQCPLPSDTPGLSSITCPCGGGYYKSDGTWVSGAAIRNKLAPPKPGT